jgi:5-(carboxyamino)imidazole ribonucleotide synthase
LAGDVTVDGQLDEPMWGQAAILTGFSQFTPVDGVAAAEKLGVVGLLAAEMFVTPCGEVLVNELAPRPHHAGNWSLDTSETSQFEQHVRAICELPLGAVDVWAPTVTVSLPGELWQSPREGMPGAPARREPNWSALLAAPRTKLHLYGEAEPRAGRKMGHFTLWDVDIERAIERAKELKDRL